MVSFVAMVVVVAKLVVNMVVTNTMVVGSYLFIVVKMVAISSFEFMVRIVAIVNMFIIVN